MRVVLFLFSILFCFPVDARPVSYPGGWTLMTQNDNQSNALHLHYSPNPRTSIGLRQEYFRETETNTTFLQLNALVKRINKRNSQANMYIKTGLGGGLEDGIKPAAFFGTAFDWEDRRYFTSYENRAVFIEDTDQFIMHRARIGFAPYEGDYGDIHTWFMVETNYDPGRADELMVTPLVRFFKGPHLLEAGYNLDGGVMFNFYKRF